MKHLILGILIISKYQSADHHYFLLKKYAVLQDGLFSHYERKGIGYAVELSEDDLNLEHNYFYEFNLDMTNSLGYRHIITTKGILIDFTTPEPGKLIVIQ